MASEQERVWASVDDEDCVVLATVEERFGGSVHLSRLHAPPGVEKTLVIPEEEFGSYLAATGDLDTPVDDLVKLNDVNQGALLHTLRQRYARDDVYTAIGPILMAVNPFKKLDICSSTTIARMAAEARPTDELPPHIFKTVKAAYSGMVGDGKPQSILISGESGAGKTETAKLCMSCLVEISESSGSSTQAALESAALLEAFGNARTVHNSNSSRFGRWCSVHFDNSKRISTCRIQVPFLGRRLSTPRATRHAPRATRHAPRAMRHIAPRATPRHAPHHVTRHAPRRATLRATRQPTPPGLSSYAQVRLQVYLLERSRIVMHGEGERNYHIFYYMINGCSAGERESYKLLPTVSDYAYMAGSGPAVTCVGEGVDEPEEWKRTLDQLQLLGFSTTTRQQLFQA